MDSVRFLKTEHLELAGQTALEAMRSGRHRAVCAAAANQMGGNFS